MKLNFINGNPKEKIYIKIPSEQDKSKKYIWQCQISRRLYMVSSSYCINNIPKYIKLWSDWNIRL